MTNEIDEIQYLRISGNTSTGYFNIYNGLYGQNPPSSLFTLIPEGRTTNLPALQEYFDYLTSHLTLLGWECFSYNPYYTAWKLDTRTTSSNPYKYEHVQDRWKDVIALFEESNTNKVHVPSMLGIHWLKPYLDIKLAYNVDEQLTITLNQNYYELFIEPLTD